MAAYKTGAPSELTNATRCVDLELDVQGIKTLYDSLRHYVTMVTLDGENKYWVEGFGLQDAWRGITFQSFPPVLHLQLNRYKYDMQFDTSVKVPITCTLDKSLALT